MEILALAWLKAFGILCITLHSHPLYNEEDKDYGRRRNARTTELELKIECPPALDFLSV